MKRASYKEAINWIAYNDCPDDKYSLGHITSCLIADLFEVDIVKVLTDVFKVKEKENANKK